MDGAPAQLVAVVIATPSPDELAAFWARALRWDVHTGGGRDVDVVARDATTFRLTFRPPGVEKDGQNRIHFDVTTASPDDQAATVDDLLRAGASHVDIGQGPDETHVVLADPDGNELCIIEPYNRFLATCPRLGAVNCDGTRALGQFFHAALRWPLVWDQDEETAIQAPDGTGPKITWSGPPLMPKPPRDRFHLHLAPSSGTTMESAIDGLVALGARRVDATEGCEGATVLADVDGNAFCLVDRPAVPTDK